MAGLLAGAILAAAWIAVGAFALLPTTIVAIVLAFDHRPFSKRLPFAWFLLTPMLLGMLLRISQGMELLPLLQVWLATLAEMRSLQTVLAVELLRGEETAEGPYLMIVVGEVATAICVLFLAARPGMWARSVQYVFEDFTSNPTVKLGGLGLFLVVLAALLCWALLAATIEQRRLEFYSFCLPVAPFATCMFAAVGWQMLFAGRPHSPGSQDHLVCSQLSGKNMPASRED